MYLVKSCYQQDNIWRRKTVKVGTLTEYRDTEDKQIADKEEGIIRLFFDLKDFHMSYELMHHLNSRDLSGNDFFMKKVILGGHSVMFSNHLFFPIYQAESTLTKANRFIFCISYLSQASECEKIFEKYDDYWHLDYSKARFFGEILAKSVLAEVIKRTAEGEVMFTSDDEQGELTIRWHFSNISYTERDIHINNSRLYTDQHKIVRWLLEGHLVKPDIFSHEKEVRYVFDIFRNNKLLTPLNKPLFVNAEELLNLVNS